MCMFEYKSPRLAAILLGLSNSAVVVFGAAIAFAWLPLRQCSLREKVMMALLGDLAAVQVAAMVAMGRAQEVTAIARYIAAASENENGVGVGPTCEIFRRETKVNANYVLLLPTCLRIRVMFWLCVLYWKFLLRLDTS
ncbi:hypothetical protein FCM35_KLT18506 [Carex littledalei]|uniref:DUF7358 domain-containing protein n=1 Tax=Carex littledalei TaxID=544730 RepID=A0A833VYX2_9POAL|nr:hypothetical protein FCM35_KLT18506 [Carex littledalei]